MIVPISHFLMLSALLFTIGVVGVLTRRNVIIIFMSIELMLNAVNVAFVALSKHMDSMDGQLFVLFIMTVAAAEAGVGLAIVISMFRNKGLVDVDQLNLMKW